MSDNFDEKYYTEKDDGLFSIGQCYDDKPASTIYCSKCGGKEFHVGSSSYFTAIKCINCEWEICIHDG